MSEEGEEEVVKMIFDLFLNKGMGYSTIARFLNQNGYTREPAPNAVNPKFNDWKADQIKRILDNPLYTSRIAWGRRRTEKVQGSNNEQRLVKQEEFVMSEKKSHEALVSEEDFQKVQEIRKVMKEKSWGNHNISQSRAHLLSGIARCPQCGSAMNVDCNQWTNKDGTFRETFTYVCSHYKRALGTKQCRRNGISAERLEREVLEYTKKLLRNPKFARDIKAKIGVAVDVTKIQEEIKNYEKELKRLARSRMNLEQDIDNLPDDKYAERKRNEFNRRLDKIYNQIYETEDRIEGCRRRIVIAEQESLNVEMIYKILLSFDEIYDKMDDREKRELIKCMIKEIKLYLPEEQKEQGHAVKSIVYLFPIEEDVIQSLRVKETHVEMVVLLSKGEINSKKVRVEFSLEDMDMSGFQKGATYGEIKAYVLEKYSLKVSSLYISQVKRKCGLDVGKNYNLSKKEETKVPQCPPEKEKAIMGALKYFGMV
ncbi:MAG: recombinase family protein [Muricomes sp.]|uniref:recombinase family protein n=1 Tax=Faecalicatena contorta TaxID=39482 RepID=UPI002EBCE71B|nr:recombinase family protein [Muricomes sp.]